MQVPIRKPGKYTYSKPDLHLTRAKLNGLKEELERLKTTNRPRAMKEVSRLAEMGDFSENAAYQIAKGRLRGLNERINELEERVKKAIVIQTKGTDTVQIGHKVTVEANGRRSTFRVLGSEESDPGQHIISYTSPLGSAVLDKAVGDRITMKVKNSEVTYVIVMIAENP